MDARHEPILPFPQIHHGSTRPPHPNYPIRYHPEDCRHPICVPGPDAPCTHMVCFPQPTTAVYAIEAFSMVVFTIDYLVRVACVHAVPYRWVGADGWMDGLAPR